MQKGDLQLPEECIAEMSGAGFRDVSVTVVTDTVRTESPEHYVEVMLRTGAPFRALEKRLGPEAWTAARSRLLEAVRKRMPAGGSDLAAEALLTSGTR
jgi:hypothetical protein